MQQLSSLCVKCCLRIDAWRGLLSQKGGRQMSLYPQIGGVWIPAASPAESTDLAQQPTSVQGRMAGVNLIGCWRFGY